MSKKSVTLRRVRSSGDSRTLTATLRPDGSLLIEGQDIGEGVEAAFGSGNWEYEWALTLQANAVAQFVSTCGGGKDVLAILSAQFSDAAAAGLQPFLDKHDIPYEFWSRVGD